MEPFSGTFRPEISLLNGGSGYTGLLGTDVHGVWQLEVKDLARGDTGILSNWSMTIETAGTPGSVVFNEPYRITDASGNYLFDDLAPGLYYVREYIQPAQSIAGWRQTWAPPPITVTSGADLIDHDFGNWIPDILAGSIEGTKFYDGDQDGVKDAGEAGIPGWIVYLDANNNGLRDVSSSATVASSTNVPLDILDLKTTQSQITVGNLGSVFDVQVTLDISHTYVGDLDVYLTSPSGRRVELFTNVGGQYNDLNDITFSDDAARSITELNFNDLPYTGTWRPESNLSFLNGEDALGIWTLSVSDTVAGDQGTLNSWSLSFNSGESFRITDENGNFKFDNVAAGTYNVREEAQSGWNPVAPAATTIPGAVWSSSRWSATVNALDVFNVQNVNFGSAPAITLAGDYDRNGVVDSGDYIVWRRASGSNVASFSGADGNGDGVVNQADFTVWRQNYGKTLFGGGAGSGSESLASASGASSQTVQASQPVSPAGGLESFSTSTDDSSLATEPVALATPPAASASAPSAAASGQLFDVANSAVSVQSSKLVFQKSSTSSADNDLGLLAWLATSASEDSQTDGASSADSDFATSSEGDESDSVDAAFDLFEGNALVLAAI